MRYWLAVAGTREEPLLDNWYGQVVKWLAKRGPVHMLSRQARILPGDRLVMYASGTPERLGAGRIFAVREAVTVVVPSGDERWPWKVEVRDIVLGPPLPDCPTIDDIGVEAKSVRRQTHIRLKVQAGVLAEQLLKEAAIRMR